MVYQITSAGILKDLEMTKMERGATLRVISVNGRTAISGGALCVILVILVTKDQPQFKPTHLQFCLTYLFPIMF